MSKGGALVRFIIGAPHGTTRPRHATFGAAAASSWWRCLGPATLVLPVGTSPFCIRRLTVAQKFGTGC